MARAKATTSPKVRAGNRRRKAKQRGIARGEGLESPDMSVEEMLALPDVDMDAVERWLMEEVRTGGTVAVKMQAAKILSDRRKQLTIEGAITIVQVPVLYDEAIAAAADAEGLVDASHWDTLPGG